MIYVVQLYFCPALTKLALDLHVNFCMCVCIMYVCMYVRMFSGLFFEASDWLLVVVLAPRLSN